MYLAVIIDLHSRAVIGWSMDTRMQKSLVCDALLMALFKRKFPKGVIVHSDRGSQYCSHEYRPESIGSRYRPVGGSAYAWGIILCPYEAREGCSMSI